MTRALLAIAALALTLGFAPEATAAPDPTKFSLEWSRGGALDAPDVEPEVGRRDQAVSDLSVEERKKIQAQLKLRRKLADVHQVLAFTTTGLILAAEVVGAINIAALDKGSPVYGNLKPSLGTHRVLAGAALSTYFAAGFTAWAMPPAYKANIGVKSGKKKVDSGDVHVALSVGHGIGMATMLATGLLMANAADNKAWKPLAVTHTTVGFATAAMVLGAAIVINTL